MQLRATRLTSIAHAVRRAIASFSPASLFAANEPGVWYDPSDLTTMFQDAAGTVPVTAVEQPVGRILDKSGRGNHATQSTATSRPVLSARVNLLTKTEQFDDAVWAKVAATVTSAPDSNAPSVMYAVSSPNDSVNTSTRYVGQGATIAASTSYKMVFAAKAGGQASLRFATRNDDATHEAYFNLQTGVVTSTTAAAASISLLGGGVYRCEVTWTSGADTSVVLSFNSANSVLGDGSPMFYVSAPDLRVSNTGVGLPAYQRVNTATDYDAGPAFPRYLKFDGIDDSLVTPTITPGTDKAQVFAGVRKLNTSAAFNCLIETGATGSSGFAVFAPDSNNNNYAFWLKSQSRPTAASTYASPITNVLAVEHDCAQATAALQTKPRISGASVAISASTAAAAGSFAAETLNIGRRNNASLPFNGHLHSLIVRFGPTLTAEQITQTETFVNGKTGAY